MLNIDYNTVSGTPLGFRAYELAYRFNRAFTLHCGQAKVPGSREWIESAFAPLEGPDRTMATTFFRPSLSQGIWATGQPLAGLYYESMLSNGFNTLNLTPSQIAHRMCLSNSVWYEPWGDFGRGYADWEMHAEPVVRLGGSYTFALGKGNQADSDAVENSALRLSDGTIITQTGALAPGVTLQSYDISLAAVDLSYKCRGFSAVDRMVRSESLESGGQRPAADHVDPGLRRLRSRGLFRHPAEARVLHPRVLRDRPLRIGLGKSRRPELVLAAGQEQPPLHVRHGLAR